MLKVISRGVGCCATNFRGPKVSLTSRQELYGNDYAQWLKEKCWILKDKDTILEALTSPHQRHMNLLRKYSIQTESFNNLLKVNGKRQTIHCPYTGKDLNTQHSEDVNVEHLIPWSLSNNTGKRRDKSFVADTPVNYLLVDKNANKERGNGPLPDSCTPEKLNQYFKDIINIAQQKDASTSGKDQDEALLVSYYPIIVLKRIQDELELDINQHQKNRKNEFTEKIDLSPWKDYIQNKFSNLSKKDQCRFLDGEEIVQEKKFKKSYRGQAIQVDDGKISTPIPEIEENIEENIEKTIKLLPII